jgi:NADH:ubiquinone oxidoreductase subunit E
MKIRICIGSACHIKGAYEVIEILKNLVAESDINGEIELMSSFCMGACGKGVSVQIDDRIFSILPENTKDFYEKEILGKQE